jgi:hypothetical protein
MENWFEKKKTLKYRFSLGFQHFVPSHSLFLRQSLEIGRQVEDRSENNKNQIKLSVSGKEKNNFESKQKR